MISKLNDIKSFEKIKGLNKFRKDLIRDVKKNLNMFRKDFIEIKQCQLFNFFQGDKDFKEIKQYQRLSKISKK